MIAMDKTYRTANGKPVRILCIDRGNADYPVVALVGTEQDIETYTSTGGYYDTQPFSVMNLVEVLPYDDFKIDEPVMVKLFNEPKWVRRHFAGVAPDGKALVWIGGYTSFTLLGGDANKLPCEACRRPTPEELNNN